MACHGGGEAAKVWSVCGCRAGLMVSWAANRGCATLQPEHCGALCAPEHTGCCVGTVACKGPREPGYCGCVQGGNQGTVAWLAPQKWGEPGYCGMAGPTEVGGTRVLWHGWPHRGGGNQGTVAWLAPQRWGEPGYCAMAGPTEVGFRRTVCSDDGADDGSEASIS